MHAQARMRVYACFSLVTPDIALSKFKKCGFPIKDLNTVKEKQEHSSSGYYFDHGECCYYY
jgi:hypothetical protein